MSFTYQEIVISTGGGALAAVEIVISTGGGALAAVEIVISTGGGALAAVEIVISTGGGALAAVTERPAACWYGQGTVGFSALSQAEWAQDKTIPLRSK